MKKLILILLFCSFYSFQSYAGCAMRNGDRLIEGADLIFVGEVKKSQRRIFGRRHKARFKVLEEIKGTDGEYVDIYHFPRKNLPPKNQQITSGNTFLVFVQERDGREKYRLPSCLDRAISIELIRTQTGNFSIMADLRALVDTYPDIKNKVILSTIEKFKGIYLGF